LRLKAGMECSSDGTGSGLGTIGQWWRLGAMPLADTRGSDQRS
jgi:hypothetical protein